MESDICVGTICFANASAIVVEMEYIYFGDCLGFKIFNSFNIFFFVLNKRS